MSLKYGLLGLLNYGPKTGYELNKVFEDSLSFFWQAKASQIYRELDAMERCGWLKSERIIQNDKPNKRVYSLTDKGTQEFLDWLLVPETDILGAARVKSAFLMRVFFAGELPVEQAKEMLGTFRDSFIKRSQNMSAAHGAISEYQHGIENPTKALYWKIAALYGETYYQAGIEWVEKAIAILEERQ